MPVHVTAKNGLSNMKVIPQLSFRPPRIFMLSEHSGPPWGGTRVVISGEYFPMDVSVLSGNRPFSNVTWISPRKVIAVTPGHFGVQNITVVVGSQQHSTQKQFKYFPPVIYGVFPTFVGGPLLIKGDYFPPDGGIRIEVTSTI